MKYANIKDGKVVKEVTKIPNNSEVSFPRESPSLIIAKKYGWLPVEEIIPKLSTGQKLGNPKYEVLITKVKKTYDVIDIDLDTLKENRIKDLGNYLAPKYPEQYAQINASNGIYDEKKSALVISEVKQWRDYYYVWKGNIENCTTAQEVNDIDFITEEDKALYEEDMI